VRAVLFVSTLGLACCAYEQREGLYVPAWAGNLDPVTFTSADGVEIELEEAWIVLADLRLEAPSSGAAKHPGHDFSGATSCELLGSWELDLLGEPLELGEATCLDGELATGRVVLSATPALSLAGIASIPDGGERPFSFELDLDDEITGIPMDDYLDASAPPLRLVLGISPAAMLSFVDWSSEDSDGDDLLSIEDDLLGNTVTFGAVSTASFTLTIED
jgi:hypothetical protein